MLPTDELPAASDEALERARAIEELEQCVSEGPPVVILDWPADQVLLGQLSRDRVPRLLLVPPDGIPIVEPDVLQDWIRLPAPTADLRARLARLRRVSHELSLRPFVPGDGRLLYDQRWVVLSDRQELIAPALAEHFGEPVTTDALLHRGGLMSRDGLRVAITGLRRTLGPLGLEIVSLHGLGYSLRACPPASTGMG